MARQARVPMTERREEMLMIVANAFSELGYRRATTAELAERCGVQENVLYRVWPSKQAMFVAVIEHIYDRTIREWEQVLARAESTDPAEAILAHEVVHHGENRLYRIIFAGLTETNEPEIHTALQGMYRRFQRYIQRLISAHRSDGGGRPVLSPAVAAWALIGIGIVEEVGQELNLIGARGRGRVLRDAGRLLLDGTAQTTGD